MSPIYFVSILGVLIAVAGAGAITPSVSNSVKARSVETTIAREHALVQQIIRFRAANGSYPADMNALVSAGFWKAADTPNGFGGAYSFTVDSAKNTITLTSSISDATTRSNYLSSVRHAFAPVHVGSGQVSKTFVIPNKDAAGALLPSPSQIPAQAAAPSPATNSYWYDTSGSTAILKVSNGTGWVASTSQGSSSGGGSQGTPAPTSSNIVTGAASLPSQGQNGDVRYVYDSSNKTMTTVVYFNGSWVQKGSGSNNLLVASLAQQALPVGVRNQAYNFDFKPSLGAMFVNTYSTATIDQSKVTWSLAAGLLPTGMALNASTGVLSGTPTTATSGSGVSLTITANYQGNLARADYTLIVN